METILGLLKSLKILALFNAIIKKPRKRSSRQQTYNQSGRIRKEICNPSTMGGLLMDPFSWPQVEDAEYFQTLPENTIFIVLRQEEATNHHTTDTQCVRLHVD